MGKGRGRRSESWSQDWGQMGTEKAESAGGRPHAGKETTREADRIRRMARFPHVNKHKRITYTCTETNGC